MSALFSPLASFLRSDIFIPTLLLVVYVSFLIIAKGAIPTADELIKTFSNLYAKYGYEIILAAAFLESLVLVNFFVPGQVAMALGVIFAKTGQTELTAVILTASLGAISGYLLDFVLGMYGFSDILKKIGYGQFILRANQELKKAGARGLALGFIHTNIGSFLSLAAGTANYKFYPFFIIASVSTFVWASIWAFVIYALGEVFLLILTRYMVPLVLIIIGILFLSKYWKERNV